MANSNRKKKPLLRRIRHHIKKRKWIIPAIILVIVAVAVAAVFMASDLHNQEELQVSADSSINIGSGYRDVSWNGDRYRYNNRITAILFAGLDSEGDLEELLKYTMAPRADSIQLLILDQKTHEMKILGINRDTMTKIRKYALDGKDRGMLVDHLSLSYAYGNGGRVSCNSLCEAVSTLLYDIPIRDYVVVNRSSLKELAQIIGPVEVTVPNNDLADLDATFMAGETVTIDGDNLEFYVRSRDTMEDQSNIGRMQRQESYISAAMGQILEKISEHPASVWEDMEKIESCMRTSITRSRYLELANELKDVSYSYGDYMSIEGEQGEGDFYDEFYPDQEALLEQVLDLFYIKQ